MQVSIAEFHKEVERLRSQISGDMEGRYAKFATVDPFPEIPPALLHAGHVASYALVTGMIDPFEVEALSKPATYLVPLGGPVRYLDEHGALQSIYLSEDPNQKQTEFNVCKEFVLKSNSLCYVTLRPVFRFPAYIAGRFNLLIRDVYRGLLVGTGPLVDPGFVGRLSIPVHNFTTREYIFRAGEGFVYFEFTKLSWSIGQDCQIEGVGPRPIDVQPPFPSSKTGRRVLDDYLVQATGSGPAQNAIGMLVKSVSETADKAERRLRWFTIGSLSGGAVGVIAVAIALGGLVVAAWQLHVGAVQLLTDEEAKIAAVHEELKSVEEDLEALRGQVGALHSKRPASAESASTSSPNPVNSGGPR